jgi:hypothetical protein
MNASDLIDTLHVPLFDDTIDDAEYLRAPADTAELAQKLNIIRRAEQRQVDEKGKAAEALAYYDRRIEGLQKGIDFMKGQVEGFLSFHDMKSLSTYAGTAIMTTRTEKIWPSDEDLLEWAEEKQINDSIVVSKKPLRSIISKYIKERGETPPGYEEHAKTTLQIRKPVD